VRQATNDFVQELRHRDRTHLARVNVLLNGNIVLAGLRIESGDVTMDRRRSPRGHLNLTVAEPTLIPAPEGGLLSPLGYELQVYCGTEIRGLEPSVAYSGVVTDDEWVPLTDGSGRYILAPGGGAVFVAGRPASEELLSLGVFPLKQARTDVDTLLTSVSAIDRTQWLLNDKLESDMAWPDTVGGSLEAHVERLIRTCQQLSDPDTCALRFSGDSHSPPIMIFPQDTSKWDVIERVVQGLGYEAYFDGAGDFIWQPVPSLEGEPQFELNTGVGGTVTGGVVDLDSEPAFNKIIAVGGSSNETAVYRGEAVDDDPLSPTRYNGPFGRKQRVIRSSTYTSDAQAQAAAEAELRNCKGLARAFDLSSVPDARLEPGDVGRVNISRVAVSAERIILDAITYDLSPEAAMTTEARSRPEVDS
jgi:hypothetical protein